jgi:hypothetical protein
LLGGTFKKKRKLGYEYHPDSKVTANASIPQSAWALNFWATAAPSKHVGGL